MTTQDNIASSKKVELTFTLPSINVKALSTKISTLLSNIYRPISNSSSKASATFSSRTRGFKLPNLKDKFNFNKDKMKFVFPAVVGIVAVVAFVSIVRSLPDAQSRPVVDSQNSQIAVPDALATINLNRAFAFPLRDDAGKEVGSFDFIVERAELKKQIIVQGKRATAVNGRIFLVADLKIVNDLKFPMELPTRNFMRVVLNNNDKELLAPDIHNDPVEVQAISTKYTRVGLAIDESAAKNPIKLIVGEIEGEKQTIELNFKY
jgi:hypothetical protein